MLVFTRAWSVHVFWLLAQSLSTLLCCASACTRSSCVSYRGVRAKPTTITQPLRSSTFPKITAHSFCSQSWSTCAAKKICRFLWRLDRSVSFLSSFWWLSLWRSELRASLIRTTRLGAWLNQMHRIGCSLRGLSYYLTWILLHLPVLYAQATSCIHVRCLYSDKAKIPRRITEISLLAIFLFI